MDSCKECHYVIAPRARNNVNHCHHCHFIGANRTELNYHLRVHLSTNVPLLRQQDWPQTESQEDKNNVQSVPDVKATPADRSSSSFEEGRDAESSFKKKREDESLNMTTSTLNEDVTMNSDDFMNTSIDANISINSEDYESYINGEDFKPSDKCSELELSMDEGSESDVKEEPSEMSTTVDDILAKYSHLQSLESPASLETSGLNDGSVIKSEVQEQAKVGLKQVPLKTTVKPSSMKPNVVENFKQSNQSIMTTKTATPKVSKAGGERKVKTPRTGSKGSPRKVQANVKNPLNKTNQTTTPLGNPSEENIESKPSNPKGQKQGPKGGKTPNRTGKKVTAKSVLNDSVVGINSINPNELISSPTTVQSQPGGTPASGKKPAQLFKCDECDKSLASKFNLNKHKLIHDKKRASGTS